MLNRRWEVYSISKKALNLINKLTQFLNFIKKYINHTVLNRRWEAYNINREVIKCLDVSSAMRIKKTIRSLQRTKGYASSATVTTPSIDV